MIDWTEQPELDVYKIAESWAEEINGPLLNIIRRMAPSILNGELRTDFRNPFPDEFEDKYWIEMYKNNNLYCSYRDGQFKGEWISSPADYALSVLVYLLETSEHDETDFLKNLRRKAISHYGELPYPQGFGFFSEKSLKDILKSAVIHKTHFRDWCPKAGYELPNFWFGEQIQALEEPFGKLEGETGYIKDGRVDAMSSEIEDIIKSGTPAKVEMVWRELVKRADITGGCVLKVETTDAGPKICWRTANGLTKRLNKKALSGRLGRRVKMEGAA